MANETEKEVKKPLWRRILSWVMTGIIGLIIVGFVTIQINGMVNKDKYHGVNMAFGNATLIVLTDSMEPDYMVGSAIFIKDVEPSTIKEGDDLTFYWASQRMVVTHRVLGTPELKDGKYWFTCHGINSNSDQCTWDCTDQTQYFSEDDLIGKVTGNSVLYGKVYSFFTSIWGLILLLAIPTVYLIGTSVGDIVKAMKEDDDEPAKAASAGAPASIEGMSQEDIERLKQDMLNEMLEEKMSKKEDE